MIVPSLKTEEEALLALSQTPGIGPVLGKALIQKTGSALAVFHSNSTTLEKIDGIGASHIQSLKKPINFKWIYQELAECKRRQIQLIPFHDSAYPIRLKQLVDSPLILYSKGVANLNAPKTLGIVGTRKPTRKGVEITQQIVQDLAPYGVQVISGMAYGIDSIAHQSAIKHQVATVGILAHGLDQVYPKINETMAREMVLQGGNVMTEMPLFTALHPDLFPRRNRIVAGMCDALLVVESAVTGGSMATAQIAHSYDREVLVIPGHPFDPMSKGCNAMIKRNVARPIEAADDIIQWLKWDQLSHSSLKNQLDLFPSLSDDEKTLMQLLHERQWHIDELMIYSSVPLQRLTLALLELELKGLIQTLPGKLYQRVC